MALYNPSEYLQKAIQSILNQSYPVKEIILVNDGGREDSIRSMLPANRKIRYYSKENGGVASARNFAIGQATGDFIAMLDQDDYWHENKLEKQLHSYSDIPCLIASPVEIIGANPRRVFSKNRRARLHYRRALRTLDQRKALLRGNFVYSSSPLIHRSVFEEIGAFSLQADPHDDWEFYLRAVFAGIPLILCEDRPLSTWRMHGANESGDLMKMLRTKCRVLRQYVHENDRDLRRIARREYASEAAKRANRLLFKRGKLSHFSRAYSRLLRISFRSFNPKYASRALIGAFAR